MHKQTHINVPLPGNKSRLLHLWSPPVLVQSQIKVHYFLNLINILRINTIQDIVPIPSNIKYVLEKWTWEDSFINMVRTCLKSDCSNFNNVCELFGFPSFYTCQVHLYLTVYTECNLRLSALFEGCPMWESFRA